MMTYASDVLYTASKRHVYFKKITIVLPKTWKTDTGNDIISGPQFDLSHIIIDKGLHENRPGVFGMTECGVQAQYISIPYQTVLNVPYLPTIEKAIVHEWAHFRWGIFDEYPETEMLTTESSPIAYTAGGSFKPNTCSTDIKGEFLLNCAEKGSDCTLDDGGQLEGKCKFCPFSNNKARASLMGYQWLWSVVEFCDDEANDPDLRHNVIANTRQNKYCNMKSAWEVMRAHPDFKGTQPGPILQDTTPSFHIVKQGVIQIVLVLDVSGSMIGDKLDNLVIACTDYIQTRVREGTVIGIVTFNSKAQVIYPMTMVKNKGDRDDLVKVLPTSAIGGTSIGAGMLKAIELQSLSISVSPDESYKGTFVIDSSIGRNTEIKLTGNDVSNMRIAVTLNSNTTYKSSKTSGKRLSLKLPEIIKPGVYSFVIETTQVNENIILSIESSQMNSETEPIVARTWTSTKQLDVTADTHMKIYASIFKGRSPIIDANVTIIIEDNIGDFRSISLEDNGSGSDLLQGDGIYSAYILPRHLKVNGRHSIKLVVSSLQNKTQLLVQTDSINERTRRDANETEHSIFHNSLILIAPISFEKLGGDESQTVGPWCWLKTNGKSTDAIWLFITGKGIILIPPSAMDVLGDDSHTSGPWCWIKTKDNSSNIVWLFLAGKAYEIGTYLIVVILYIWMKIIIRKASKENNSWIRGRRGIRQEDEKFWLTWIVMLVLRLPGTLRTFISISDPKSGFNIFLMYLQSFGDPGQAFINCIIYCFLDRDVQDYMKEVLLEYKNGLCNSYEIIEDSSQPLK
ncbi:hypothetical protein FSP39_012186 [Pinctada imbricata]|uniref:VWFA domain-containing protein n=1 Tax=Pinctada imbricata TaxID=66713 RepID=A0AA88YCL0_PINIB|nr:hypothetical protein FSP39_012186 [Pinctada imbricata]